MLDVHWTVGLASAFLAFTTAHESKEFNPFFEEVYTAWFTKHPLDKLKMHEKGEKLKGLEEAEAAGNMEKVEKIRVAWWEQVSIHGHDVELSWLTYVTQEATQLV